MQSRRIARGDPECVYISVRNAGTVALEVGHHAMFAFHSSTYADGVNVCMFSTTNLTLWQLAGAVSRYPIPPGAKGLVQVFGYHQSLSCTVSTTGITNWTTARDYVLSPIISTATTSSRMFTLITMTGWVPYGGIVINLASESNAQGATNASGYWAGFIRGM